MLMPKLAQQPRSVLSAHFEDKPLDIVKVEAEIEKLMAETGKLNADADRYRREARWLPVAWATGLVAAVSCVSKFLH